MPFQIHGLQEKLFAGLFSLSDEELTKYDAQRVVVDNNPGFPCRVSLADAKVGETVILVNFEHQPNASPYRSCHAVFVREGVKQTILAPNQVPESIRRRLMSVRSFDDTHQMIDADVVDGEKLEGVMDRMFEDSNSAYLHLHNARPGCFAASVTRV